jgi:uncharacterized protein YbjT (DUF2867 family)
VPAASHSTEIKMPEHANWNASASFDRPLERKAGPILVFGATGQQGGAVARQLRFRGWEVRAFIRNEAAASAKALSGIGIDLVVGDLFDGKSIRDAMSGAYGVFSVQPNSGQSALSDEDEIAIGRAIVDSCLQQEVGHLVYSSALLVSKGPTGIPNLDCKLDIEKYVRSSGVRSTIVRPATFMELLLDMNKGLDRGEFSFFVRPDQPTPLIAVDDIGKAVAAIFDGGGRFDDGAVDLAGDTPTGEEIGRALSAASGRPIHYGRYADDLLAANPALARLVPVFESDRWASPDLPSLNRQVGPLLTFEEWLAGPGRNRLAQALSA